MLRQLLGRRWSRAAQTLRYTPLLSDPDDQEERKEENSNEEKITEVCKEEEKLQSKADYKIAVSHFVVSCDGHDFQSQSDMQIENLFILNTGRQTTSPCCRSRFNRRWYHASLDERCLR